MANELPAPVEQFIVQHIESLGQLEVLLLVRQEPERWWRVEEIARALYTPVEICAGVLADLARRGFLAAGEPPEPPYRYQPATSELDGLVDAVAETYRERRVAVITAIYSRPVSKVQTFADAFRIRKEP
jgi:hypothetical protein